MSQEYSDTFVFLLYGNGTFAWVNTDNAPSGDASEKLLGEAVWKRCGPDDQDRVREGLAELMLDQQKSEIRAVVRNIAGERLLVSMNRLPIAQTSQHAVVGWCRRLSDDVLKLSDRERHELRISPCQR